MNSDDLLTRLIQELDLFERAWLLTRQYHEDNFNLVREERNCRGSGYSSLYGHDHTSSASSLTNYNRCLNETTPSNRVGDLPLYKGEYVVCTNFHYQHSL